jgi:hypothetical protein
MSTSVTLGHRVASAANCLDVWPVGLHRPPQLRRVGVRCIYSLQETGENI